MDGGFLGTRRRPQEFEISVYPPWASLGALFRLSWAVSCLGRLLLGPSWCGALLLGLFWGPLGGFWGRLAWSDLGDPFDRLAWALLRKAKKKERRINMLNIIYL